MTSSLDRGRGAPPTRRWLREINAAQAIDAPGLAAQEGAPWGHGVPACVRARRKIIRPPAAPISARVKTISEYLSLPDFESLDPG
jgi:hypothetical protein